MAFGFGSALSFGGIQSIRGLNIVTWEADPIDAVMSAWGDWGTCYDDCGTRTETRTRTCLQEERGGGTPCSSFATTDMNDCALDGTEVYGT